MSSKLIFSFKGDEILSLYVAPTRDNGFTMGFTDPAFKNIHFTAYLKPKDNRIHSHITDNSKGPKPYSQQIDSELYAALIRKVTKNWVVPVERIRNLYVPTKKLSGKINEVIPKKVNDKKLVWPIESYFTFVKADLRNKKRWTKISLRELLRLKISTALTIYRNSIHLVAPIPDDGSHVLCFTQLQYRRFTNRMLRLMGLDIFTNYIDTLNTNMNEEFSE